MSRILYGSLGLMLIGFIAVFGATAQTISFRSMYVALGDADFSPATASSGLTVTYTSSDTNVATVVSGQIHIVGLGFTDITASQAGNGTYSAAISVVRRITVGLGLPDMLAIEMPNPGQTTILAEDATMATLLAKPHATGLQITHNRSGFSFPIGGTEVVWTAWAGAPNASAVLRQETGLVWVFRYGQTPLGVSGPIDDDEPSDASDIRYHYSRALGGNAGTNIVRDSSGDIHVVWSDGELGRPYRLWYRRGVQNSSTGVVTWTDPFDIADGLAMWESFASLTSTANAIHFAWPGSGRQVKYRRLLKTNGVWAFEAIQNTGVVGGSHDQGVDIAAFNDDEIHIVARNSSTSYQFQYGYKLLNSAWVTEVVNIRTLTGVPTATNKYTAITVDLRGDVHVAFTACIRNGGNWPQIVTVPGSGGSYYWNAWYLYKPRNILSLMSSSVSIDAFAAFPEWQDHDSVAANYRDIAADWIDLQADPNGNIYMAFHGTANNFWVGKDDAFFSRRVANANGVASPWELPKALYVVGNSPNNLGYSWAPSICADKNGMAFPVYFYKALGTPDYENYTDMDSAYQVVRNGVFVGARKPLSNFASLNMTTSFSETTAHLYRHTNGKAWLDVLQGMLPTGRNAQEYNNSDPTIPYTHEEVNGQWRLSYVVYQRDEVTSYLAPYITTNPASITVNSGQTAMFTVAATGATITGYQWSLGGVPIVLNGTSSSYTTPALSVTDSGGLYSVTITNASGSTTSTSATLTVQLPAADTTAPSVPTSLSSSAITSTTLTLSWASSMDAVGVTGYKIYQNGIQIGTTTGTSIGITGLTAATNYSFTVSAYDAAANVSAQSSALSVSTIAAIDGTAPSAPTGLSATAITQTTFTLSWTASTDAVGVVGYKVFQNGVQIGTSTSVSYSVTSLSAGTTYLFTVSANDAAGNNSAVSNTLSVSTSANLDTIAPSIPTNLVATNLTNTTFTLSWTASTDTVGVVGYKIFKNGTLLGTSTSASFAITGLTVGTIYSFTVSANDAAGNNSAVSSVLSVTTLVVADTIAPSKPSGLLATVITISSFSLSWPASTDAVGVVGYKIFKDGVLLGTSSTTSYSVTGLTPSNSYAMTVLAYDAASNESALSSVLTVKTLSAPDTTAPEAPTGIKSSSITDSSVTLNWSASTDADGVTTYTVFQNGEAIGTTTSLTFVATNLEPSTTYVYTVNASDEAGNNSALSGTVTVTTASATVDSSGNASTGGGGGGGCQYSKDMTMKDQAGNLILMFAFILVVFCRQGKREIKK